MFCYDYNALPKIFTVYFFQIVIVTITLPTFFVLHMNVVPHLLSQLQTLFHSMVWSKIIFYNSIIKINHLSCPFNIPYLLFKKAYKLYILRGFL